MENRNYFADFLGFQDFIAQFEEEWHNSNGRRYHYEPMRTLRNERTVSPPVG